MTPKEHLEKLNEIMERYENTAPGWESALIWKEYQVELANAKIDLKNDEAARETVCAKNAHTELKKKSE